MTLYYWPWTILILRQSNNILGTSTGVPIHQYRHCVLHCVFLSSVHSPMPNQVPQMLWSDGHPWSSTHPIISYDGNLPPPYPFTPSSSPIHHLSQPFIVALIDRFFVAIFCPLIDPDHYCIYMHIVICIYMYAQKLNWVSHMYIHREKSKKFWKPNLDKLRAFGKTLKKVRKCSDTEYGKSTASQFPQCLLLL